jgi:hypothetical protein
MPVDDFMKQFWKLRSRGPSPKLSDSEVLTMETVGEFLSFGSDKAICDYFRTHWHACFPNLGCRTTFTRQASNLSYIKQKLWEHSARQTICIYLTVFRFRPVISRVFVEKIRSADREISDIAQPKTKKNSDSKDIY